MKNLLFIAILAISISGCTFPNVHEELRNGLPKLQGKSQEELFRVLGYPDDKQIIDDKTVVYIWRNSFSMTWPSMQNTTGYIGNTPFNMQTRGPGNTVYYQCVIKYAVRNGYAYRGEYFGDAGGCEKYMIRLKNYKTN